MLIDHVRLLGTKTVPPQQLNEPGCLKNHKELHHRTPVVYHLSCWLNPYLLMAISPLNLQILGITAPSFRQVVIANHNATSGDIAAKNLSELSGSKAGFEALKPGVKPGVDEELLHMGIPES